MKNNAYIIIVDDEEDICDLVKDILEDEGYEVGVANNGEEAKALKKERTPDLILLDIWMPDIDGISLLQEWRQEDNFCPVIMMSGHGTLEHAIEATKLGASDFLEKPLTLAKLLLVVEKTLEESAALGNIISPSVSNLEKPHPFEPVGRSLLMKSLRNDLEKAAKNQNTNILLLGEKGSELSGLASYIHDISDRNTAPFIELSLTTLGDRSLTNILLNEHPMGSPLNLLERANNGILFLKNIDEISPHMQDDLYRILNTNNFIDPQTKQLIQPNVRYIFSSHSDLQIMAEEGDFNLDLWHLINELPISIPALRNHPEDVPELIAYYVHYFVEEEHLTYRHFSIAAQNRLRNHDWFGNNLELRNLIKRLLILGKHEEVSLDEVNATLQRETILDNTRNDFSQLPLELPLREAREQFERAYLIAQYKRSEGNIANLAERVGMERTNLYRKLKSLDIDPKKGY